MNYKAIISNLPTREIMLNGKPLMKRWLVFEDESSEVEFNQILFNDKNSHRHAVEIQSLILENGYTEWIDDKPYLRKPGDLLIMKPRHKHRIQLHKKNGELLPSLSLIKTFKK